MTEPKVEAGDRALETARKIVIDDTFVAAVEDELGMGHGAWDMLDPAEVCKAVLKVGAALIQSAMNAGIPIVQRATGRTIPDLTKREHVCEYQSAISGKAESAMNAQQRELREALSKQGNQDVEQRAADYGRGYAEGKMAERGELLPRIAVLRSALNKISQSDPPGEGCDLHCSCIGCIARKALAELRRGTQ